MRNTILYLFSIMAVLTTVDVMATEVLNCHSCSASQYRAMARNAAPNEAGNYEFYVADARNDQLSRFNVYVEREQGFISKFPILMTNETEVQVLFNDYVAAYRATQEAYDHGYFVIPFPDVSAYDLRGGGNRQFETAISRHLWTDSNVFTRVAMFISTGYALFGHLINVDVYVEVGFPDGSRVEMKIVGLNSDGSVRFKYREGTAVTVEENAIPDNLNSFINHAGVYSAGNALNDFLYYAAGMGVPVTYKGSGGITYTVTCRQETGKVVCTARKDSK